MSSANIIATDKDRFALKNADAFLCAIETELTRLTPSANALRKILDERTQEICSQATIYSASSANQWRWAELILQRVETAYRAVYKHAMADIMHDLDKIKLNYAVQKADEIFEARQFYARRHGHSVAPMIVESAQPPNMVVETVSVTADAPALVRTTQLDFGFQVTGGEAQKPKKREGKKNRPDLKPQMPGKSLFPH